MKEVNENLENSCLQASIDLLQGLKGIPNNRALAYRINRIAEDLQAAANEYYNETFPEE